MLIRVDNNWRLGRAKNVGERGGGMHKGKIKKKFVGKLARFAPPRPELNFRHWLAAMPRTFCFWPVWAMLCDEVVLQMAMQFILSKPCWVYNYSERNFEHVVLLHLLTLSLQSSFFY